MTRWRYMPVALLAIAPTEGYPDEPLSPMAAREWGDLLSKLYEWDTNLLGIRYDNFDYPVEADVCREIADVIESHLEELTGDEREYWARLIPYFRFSGGFRQAGGTQGRPR